MLVLLLKNVSTLAAAVRLTLMCIKPVQPKETHSVGHSIYISLRET